MSTMGREDDAAKASPARLKPLDIAALRALNIPPREMILNPAIPEKGSVMLYAGRGTGKTFFAIGMAVAVSTGTAFLKWDAPKPRRVLHLDGEMAASELRERIVQAVAACGVEPKPGMLNILSADLIEFGIGNLASVDVQQELEACLVGVELLVLDNLSSLTAVIRDNDAESWNPIQEWLLRLRRRGVSVLIVHHAGKSGGQRGTSRREDILDTSISLRRPADYTPTEGARFEVHFEKARGIHGDRAKPFETKMEVRDGKSIWRMRELEDAELARVKALCDDGLSIREIAAEMGLSKSKVQRIKGKIDAMGQDDGTVSHDEDDDHCPTPQTNGGTPAPVGNQGKTPTVPLSHAARVVGRGTAGHCKACDGSGCPTCQPQKFNLNWNKGVSV